jgi:hypothetical protein
MREHERARKDPERTDHERRPDVPDPAADLLALQRTAGNRAVGALLSRQPQPTAPKEKPKAPAEVTGNRVVFPGIGTIPVESVQLATSRAANSPTGSGSDREGGAASVSEVVITSLQGEHSTALFKASLDGKGADVEVILERGKETIVIELTNALVTHYAPNANDHPPRETWTLNATGIKFRRPGDKDEEKTGSRSEWNLE